jgi:hypothetical protein
MDITSAAATARDAAAVRPAAAARPGAPAPPPPPPAFTYSATDEFVTLPGDWKLQPNTSPTITIKMVYSPKALTNSLSDADIAAEVPIAFTSRLYPPVLQKFHFNVDTGLIPYHGCPSKCIYLFLPSNHRPSPSKHWVGFQLLLHVYDFPWRTISWLQIFPNVEASEFARLPGRSYRYDSFRRAAETFTSGQNIHRHLCMHRIC